MPTSASYKFYFLFFEAFTNSRYNLEKGVKKLSLELALKALKSLGLTETDAQTYVYLAKKGPHNEDELAFALNITKHQLDHSLESLVTKRMVRTTPERSVKYSAVALEEVLDQYMKATKEQAKALQARRAELLSTWRSIIEDPSNTYLI
jgi:sugar-specific transcriptional regulator TrmB